MRKDKDKEDKEEEEKEEGETLAARLRSAGWKRPMYSLFDIHALCVCVCVCMWGSEFV